MPVTEPLVFHRGVTIGPPLVVGGFPLLFLLLCLLGLLDGLCLLQPLEPLLPLRQRNLWLALLGLGPGVPEILTEALTAYLREHTTRNKQNTESECRPSLALCVDTHVLAGVTQLAARTARSQV